MNKAEKINKYSDVLNIERVDYCAKEFIRYELSLKEVDESKRHHVIALLYDDGFVDYMLTNTAGSHEEIMDIPLDEYKKLATIIEEINKD